MYLLSISALLAAVAIASPLSAPPKPLPLLIWHGLGDSFDADGLQSTGELAQQVHPGTFVFYIRTDEEGGNDRTNSFFGNVTTQIQDVCEAIHADPRLITPGRKDIRVDALGFSQGGQFLRGLIERCSGLSVRSLVTFGSQHNGISQFQECGEFDFLCKGATGLIKNNVWTELIQGKVVPAQYFREMNETTGKPLDEYLEYSNFLADVNNERAVKDLTYKKRIAALENFVMFVFADDETVIPKQSGWFAEVNATSGEVQYLRDRVLYEEDWLGLKELDQKGGLVFNETKGGHMQLDETVLAETFEKYFGPEKKSKGLVDWLDKIVPLLVQQDGLS